MINFFGEIGGFQKIIDRISGESDSVPKIKVDSVLYYLRVIDEVSEHLF